MRVVPDLIRHAKQIAVEKWTSLTQRANQKSGAGDFFGKNLIFYAAENKRGRMG